MKQQYPEPTVGALIFNKDKIFLMKSHKWRNRYVLPGGHVELGESMKEALKREIKEETGLDIYDIRLINFQEFIFDKAFWKKRHFISRRNFRRKFLVSQKLREFFKIFDFACKTNLNKVKLDSEGQDYTWVTLKEALKLPIEPYKKKTIKEYISKNKKRNL